MINETDLDTVISELRLELDRVDRAILVFERLASEKKTSRRRPTQAASSRGKRLEASLSAQPSANPN
jgi:hypothetical protein